MNCEIWYLAVIQINASLSLKEADEISFPDASYCIIK